MRKKETIAIPRLMVVGTGSGSGKTTVTCALLLVLQKRGLVPAAFKAGPDYVDPMFHSRVLGVPSRNLDLFLCGEDDVACLLAHNAGKADVAVIEGVMGLYDGLGKGELGKGELGEDGLGEDGLGEDGLGRGGLGRVDACSSNHLASLTHTPEILVVTPQGQGLSLVAQLYGYLHFLPNTIKGVIVNKVSDKMYAYYKPMLEEHLGLRCYGYMPPLPEASFSSRALGLAPPAAIEAMQERLSFLAEVAAKTLDMDGLIALAEGAEPLEYVSVEVAELAHITLAVARDEAFCFYYEDSLDLLRRLGAQIISFSPLHDKTLPAGSNGILIGGGYPEEYARQLAENTSMRADIGQAMAGGMPVMAEGGGYLYLCRRLKTTDGKSYPMVGGIASDGYLTPSLQRFGYCALTACHENMLCREGEILKAHEYHYADSSDNGNGFTARKKSGASWPCLHVSPTLFAGFPHIHFWGNKDAAAQFIEACAHYKARQQW